MQTQPMTLPEAIRTWTERQFNPVYVEQVVADLTAALTGTTPQATPFYASAQRDIDALRAA